MQFWNRWAAAVEQWGWGRSLLVGLVLWGLAGTVDWVTGPDLASSLFYLAPVAWMTWRSGRWIGLGTAVMCGVTWFVVEVLTHQKYPNELVPLWNAFVRTMIFVLVSGLETELIERKAVEERLARTNEDLQAIQKQIAEVSDREQRRLGEDLHDGLCQHLVSTAFAARKLASKLSERALSEAGDAEAIAELLGESIAQARDVARGLYLVPLEAGGLASALDEFARQVSARQGVACELTETGSAPALEEMVGTNLFRIAQESVNNALKHSQATEIKIALDAESKLLRLRISDNGKGFENSEAIGKGMGMRIMQYRARMIGAALEIGGAGGSGTVVSCSMTLREEATTKETASKVAPHSKHQASQKTQALMTEAKIERARPT